MKKNVYMGTLILNLVSVHLTQLFLYISVSFSSCFYNVEGDFLLNKINFVGGDKLSPVFKHGFLRSEENVFPVFLYTQNVYGKMLSFTILNF